MTKLTPSRRRALERLSKVKEGHVLSASGHLRHHCFVLASAGLAEHLGGDGLLNRYFIITDAGRSALKEAENG